MIEIQRRVRSADNGVQFYIEELLPVRKIKVWKIAKLYYSYTKAMRAMEKLNVSQ